MLLERHPERITFLEFLLYIWIAAFAYDEFGELRDTGSLFYTADVWNLWDVCIVLVALIFLIVSCSPSLQRCQEVSFLTVTTDSCHWPCSR